MSPQGRPKGEYRSAQREGTPPSGEPDIRAGNPADAAPLAGIRVLDLTRLLPGPVCTLYLADLGADVIKVEDTGAGDYARNLGNRPGTVSAFYRAVNRNKRSIALDLKDARGPGVPQENKRIANCVS